MKVISSFSPSLLCGVAFCPINTTINGCMSVFCVVLLRVNEHRYSPLRSFCQALALIKYYINESHSRSVLQFDSGRGGNPFERGKKLLCSWRKEEETGTATVLWLRMCLPLPSKQSADSILGAHYSRL